MTEKEICISFKRNGCCKRHITILAQLNAVDDIVICNILRRNGLLDTNPKILHKYKYVPCLGK